MKIILSRKGFDSRYGGGVSPVLPDGNMISIPIPEVGSGVAYAAIRTHRGSLMEIMHELGTTRYRENNSWHVLDKHSEAHLDPDLYPKARKRDPGWRPVFGQCDAAQSALANRGVTNRDLFIFYGTFRMTSDRQGRLRYVGKPFHAVFGYLSIGDVIRVDSSTAFHWCAEHPHLVDRARKNNTLYFAANSLVINGQSMPGSAVLPFNRIRVLSASPERVSLWQLPRFFHPEISGKTLSYHTEKNWQLTDEFALLQTKSPGQEYVVEATDQMLVWVRELLGAGKDRAIEAGLS